MLVSDVVVVVNTGALQKVRKAGRGFLSLSKETELLSNYSVLALCVTQTFASLREESSDYFIRKNSKTTLWLRCN